MHDTLINLIVVLGSATLIATLFHSVKLPPVVGFLVAGALVGPHGFGLIESVPEVEVLTEIGAVLLMFTIGLEFNLKKLFQMKKLLLGLGTLQVGLTIAVISFVCHHFLSIETPKALFIGFLFSLSSSALIFRLLQEHRSMETPYGRASLSVLLFQDLAVIPMILLIPLLAQQSGEGSGSSFSFNDVGHFLLSIVMAITVVIIGARYVVPKVLGRVVKTGSREIFFFGVLSLCVGTALYMESLGLSLSLGAFFAGIMISESPYGKQAMGDMLPMRNNFFGLFFVSIGMLMNGHFFLEHAATLVSLGLLAFSLKFLVLFIAVWILGNPANLSIITALILFQVGEFSLILADKGLQAGLLTGDDHQYVLILSFFSLIATPIVYKIAPFLGYHRIYDHFLPTQFQDFASRTRSLLLRDSFQVKVKDFVHHSTEEAEGHVIIVGFGIAGQNLASALKALEIPYRISEVNNETVKKFSKKGEPIFFGDASQEEILHQLGIERARMAVITASGAQMMGIIQRSIHLLRPDLPIIIRAQYLRDLNELDAQDKTEVVIGEIETSLEILSRTLKSFGVDGKQIEACMLETKRTLAQEMRDFSGEITLSLPSWEAFSYFRPYRIVQDDFAAARTLEDLDLQTLGGAHLAVIYRNGLGSHAADPDFEFLSGDILYFVGTQDQIDLSVSCIQRGPHAIRLALEGPGHTL